MEIHRFEKLWVVASLVLIVGFIATVTYGAVGAGVQMVDDSGGTVDPNNLDQHPRFSEPGVYQSGPNSYDVYVVARQFLFQPGTSQPIRVPAGSQVTFHVTSADVTHGFEVVGTNVNLMVIPGQIAEVTVQFDRPAEYGVVCHEYCGAGHHTMAGQLVVVPQDQYEHTPPTEDS
ncbi:MAG: cytochrome c oxidase subunit II [Haloferacaceae archaeon]